MGDPVRRPTPDDLETLERLQEHGERSLTPWEISLLETLEGFPDWAEWQAQEFDEIRRRAEGARP